MNIEPTSEQRALVDAVAGFLREQLPADRFIKGVTATADSWDALAELGLFGIALPEEAGGIGLGIADEVLVYREAGRHLVSPCAIATAIAARIAAADGNADLAAGFVAGSHRAAFGVPDGDDRLLLIDAEGSSHVLVAGATPALIERAPLGAGTAQEPFDVTLGLVEVPFGGATPGDAAAPLALQAVLLIAAYLVGVAMAARDTAVAYANQREQFGRPIGSFQGISHICAEMAVQSEGAWAQTLFAALVVQEAAADPVPQVASAQLLAVRAALLATRQTIQVHGGVGFTQEYTPHLYLKRAHLMERLLAQRPPHAQLLPR